MRKRFLNNGKRFINIRPFALFALCFIVGILCGNVGLRGHAWVFFLLLCLSLCGAVVFFLLKRFKNAVTFLLALVCGVLGFVDFNFAFKRITADEYHGEQVSVSAKLTDYFVFYRDYTFVTLSHFEVTQNGIVKKYDDCLLGCYIDAQQVNADILKESVGFSVEFECVLDNSPVFQDGVNTFYVKNKIYFVGNNVKNFTLSRGLPTFDQKARLFIKDTFYSSLTEDTAPVAVALVLGDKSSMDALLTTGYRNMGVSHIFAVSGLHVGFISAVFAFLARKMKLNRWIVLVLTFTLMLFYAWLCGFSASVIRALIMVTCGLLCANLGVKKDSLTFIALAALIILAIEPLFIFDVGFLLSFGAVLGIACVTAALNRKTSKLKKPIKSLLGIVFLSVGAMLGVFGLMGHFFGGVSLLGLAFNIFMTPLIAVCFVLLLIGLIPFLNFALFLPKAILTATNFMALKLSSAKFGIIELESLGFMLVLYFLALFIIGGYVNLNKKVKITCVSVLLSLCAAFNVYLLFPQKLTCQVSCFDVYGGQCFVLTGDRRNAYVVSNFAYEGEATQVLNFCLDKDISDIYIFVSDFSKTDIENLSNFAVYDINIKGVYLFSPYVDDVKDGKLAEMNVDKFALSANYTLSFGGTKVTCLKDGAAGGWFFETKDINLLFMPLLTQNEYKRIISCAPDAADIIFCNAEEDFVKYHSGAKALVTDRYLKKEGIFSLKVLGNFTINLNNDKITIIP